MLLKGANDLGQKGRSEPNQNSKRSLVSEEHDKEFQDFPRKSGRSAKIECKRSKKSYFFFVKSNFQKIGEIKERRSKY